MTSQFKKGIIELCVLKIASQEPLTGVQIIENMKEKLHISENTVYPILRRLTAQQFFTSHLIPSQIGAPKKVYTITEKGKTHLQQNLHEWKDFINNVSNILGGTHE